jgi:hypothetical protein
MRLPRGARGLATALSVLSLVATACSGGGDGADVGQGGRRDGREPAPTAPKFYPLTGLPVAGGPDPTRPAVTVKIENSPQSRPQAGLDKADVVFEAVVEGGQSRFLAVFQSADSDPVGPVRSVRPSDPAVVSPFGGVVAYSGGIQRFVDAMKATGLVNIDEDNAGATFQRRRDRAAPHNLYTSTGALYDRADDAKAPQKFAQFLPPGQAFAPPGVTPVSTFTLVIGRTTRASYEWDPSSSRWKRSTDGSPHMAEGGDQLAPTTVIVQFVEYEGSGEVDTTGAPVAEAKVVGSGDAVVFASGTRLDAKWSKPNATAMTTWTDAAGAPLSLPAGQTWIEMPAVGASLTTG